MTKLKTNKIFIKGSRTTIKNQKNKDLNWNTTNKKDKLVRFFFWVGEEKKREKKNNHQQQTITPPSTCAGRGWTVGCCLKGANNFHSLGYVCVCHLLIIFYYYYYFILLKDKNEMPLVMKL